MNNEIDTLFKLLELNGIKYVVLRGYSTEEELYTSRDIDLYVPENDFDKFELLVLNNGWYTPKFNINKMYHKQYFIFKCNHTLKVDVVTRLNFTENYQELANYETLINYRGCFFNRSFYTLNPIDSLYIFLMHVVFDKGHFSEENFDRLKYMVNEASKSEKGMFKFDLSEINDLSDINELRTFFDKNLRFKKSKILSFKHRIYILIYKIFSRLYLCFNNSSVSIIGVDGTGKSTTISLLSELLGRYGKTQYMGFTRYKTIFARRYNGKNVKGLFPSFIETLCVYFEMWCRYLNTRFTNKIIVYDRFVNESYINAKGLRKVMVLVLFKYFFPKPKKWFYLYCPVEVSLSRKDDILDEQKFINMKNRFDNEYLSNNHILSFDTSKLTSKEIADLIYIEISKQFPDYLI